MVRSGHDCRRIGGAFLRLLLIGSAWLAVAPDVEATSPCGGPGQRACCVAGDPGRDEFGACRDGLTEVVTCSGDCACGWPFDGFNSSSHCVQAPACGGPGQRACCIGEPGRNAIGGACQSDLIEVDGCAGGEASCICGGDGGPFHFAQSSSHCEVPEPCGGPGQRACCLGEPGRNTIGGACQDGLTETAGWGGGGCSISHCAQATACGGPGQRACCVGEPGRDALGGRACQSQLIEVIDGCSGDDCLCGGDGGPLHISKSSGHCEVPEPCGGLGQRACCVGEPGRDNIGGACQDGLTETAGWSGGGCSISHCAQATACGGEGQRACCIGEPGRSEFGACQNELTEVTDGCFGGAANCLCGGDGSPLHVAQSSTRCARATSCGGPGERACCLGEDPSLGAAQCESGHAEIPGCAGDCLCGGDLNLGGSQASGTCIKVSECGGKGQRACIVGERAGEPCDEGLIQVPRCVGDCFGKGAGSSYGISSGMCSTPETIAEPTTNRTQPPHDAPTQASTTCPLYGYMDMHLHLHSDLAHGGGVLAGTPYDETGGVNVALQQCAGTSKDLVKRDGGALLPPGIPCQRLIDWGFVESCGDKIFHGGHDLFNDGVGSPIGTADGALETLGGENSNLAAPLFNGWPRWTTTTHQQAYYKWLERAWQGGMRLTTMLAVTNETLCRANKHQKYALDKDGNPRLDADGNPVPINCEDSMGSIDEQIQAAKDFEKFIDRQGDGLENGNGWFKIAYTPKQAREAIGAGKLAVVLGVETAELFNCKFPIDQCKVVETPLSRTVTCPDPDKVNPNEPHGFNPVGPLTVSMTIDGTEYTACSAEFVEKRVQQLDELGVRHIFPIHNFDNGFGGAATWQNAIEVGNRVVENHWWFPEGCPADGGNYGFVLGDVLQFALTLLQFLDVVSDTPDRHLDTDPPSCNALGLFGLGTRLVNTLMDKGMLIDVDHMSRKAFDATLDIAEQRHYPGIVASHVLSFDRFKEDVRHERMRTKSQLERIKGVGGMIAAMLKDDGLDSDRRGYKEELDLPGSSVKNDCRHSSKSFAMALEYAAGVMGRPVGMGSDFNGTAGHFGPRFGSDSCGVMVPFDILNPVETVEAENGIRRERSAQYRAKDQLEYPFTLPGFGSFDKQVTGQRTFDYNVDGMAHIGLLPDFVADLKEVGTSESAMNMLFRSAEAYIRVWEGARGEQPDTSAPACVAVNASYAPSTIYPGTPVFFSAQTTPSGLPVTWDFGPACQRIPFQSICIFAAPGAYPVKASVTDPVFGSTVEHVMEVQVRALDFTPPVVTVPAPSITQEAAGPQGTAVVYSVTATDNVDGPVPVACTPASSSVFPLGTTTVNCVARDVAGNVGTVSFTVTVRDTAPPTVTTQNALAEATSAAGAVVNLQASAHDAVSGVLAPTCMPPSGLFPLGSTTVVCSATDAAGNTGSASLSVLVRDTTPPVVTAADVVAEATGPNGALVAFGGSAVDIVSGALPVTCTPPSPAQFPIGTSILGCRATDAAGNVGVETLDVVVRDTTPPVLSVADVTVAAPGPKGIPVVLPVSATDIVDGSVAIACVPGSGSVFPLGTTPVQCVATDDYGNAATRSLDVNVTPPATACFVVDFREITYFKNRAVITSSDEAIRLDNEISGPFDPSLWPYRASGGSRHTRSRGTLFRVYGFKPSQLGQTLFNADDPSVGYEVQRDEQVAGGAYYLELGGPARVSVCPEQLHNYVLAGEKGNGHMAASNKLPEAQRNVAGVMLTHNTQILKLPSRVRRELRDLGLPSDERGLVDYVGFQLQGKGNDDYREFVDVEISFPWDSQTDRAKHYQYGLHTSTNTSFESYAGCNYVDYAPGNDAVRLHELWGPNRSRWKDSDSWRACGRREPQVNQSRRADYDVAFDAIQLLPTVSSGTDTNRVFFGPIRPLPDKHGKDHKKDWRDWDDWDRGHDDRRRRGGERD